MASSRASSPASRDGSVEPLTPRSKIKALLATVESSDEEGQSVGKEKPKKKSPFSNGLGNSLFHTKSKSTSPRSAHNDDDSDESDVAIRPRGKLASRMMGLDTTNKEQQQVSPVAETARERVRQLLEREEAEKEREETASNGDDEDDDLPVAPRRLKRRVQAEEEESDSAEQPIGAEPGLFVSSPMRPSPTKSIGQRQDSDNEDDNDNDLPPLKSDRFKALVERKRQERLAREAAEEARKAERMTQQEKLASELSQLVSDDEDAGSGITDDEGGRQLTQKARPTRKASKKAIEEMNRETQRMARNMQLAHEAKTRKKISKASLFERFNYKPATVLQPEPQANSSSRPTTPHSDVEMKDVDTPPSSPPQEKMHQEVAPAVTIETALTDASKGVDTAMVDTTAPQLTEVAAVAADEPSKEQKTKRRVRVHLPTVTANFATLDSDDDLQIMTTTKDKIDAVFANIPTKKSGESQSLQALRALAQVKSPGKDNRRKRDQGRMTPGELQAYLQQRARQQAKLERDRRLELLKGQGIVVQTAEERERQEQEVEDLVAKAREEAQKIMQEERDAAKRERKENGEVDPLAWDDSDEEYHDSADEADAEVELSGSEDDADEDGDEDGDEETAEDAGKALFDEDAEATVSGAEEEANEDREDAEEVDAQPAVRQRRSRNKTAVLSDDEENEAPIEATPRPTKFGTQMTPAAQSTVSPAAPGSVLRSAKKSFIPGLPVQGPAGLGLTQIFAGTMDSQMSPGAAMAPTPTQSMMPDFDQFPDSNFSATADEPAEDTVVDSQTEETLKATQAVQFNLSQSQMHGLGSLFREGSHTQMSETIEPSQDAGLAQHTPLRERFVEPPFSTVETMVLDKQDDSQPHESPLVRRGRLRRKLEMQQSAVESTAPIVSAALPSIDEENAFNVMDAAAKKEKKSRQAEDFDRKKSKAKEMVEDQAEESEDEYAGLGGADGEDSDNESNASVEQIIDDAAGNDGDEHGKLAAFYADRERATDEQQVEKLFKDITTGMLRRKRGADFDLSDSDDDGEARRRMKRRQFAKMQKALFADERVKKIAENPGNQAFLRTIEDHGSDDDMDILDVFESSSQVDSQSQSQDDAQQLLQQPQSTTTIPDSQPLNRADKQPLGVSSENRAPAPMRRTKGGKKPANIGEVRETLSNLLDEPQGSIIPATEAGSDSEDEQDHDEDASSPSHRSNKENQVPSRGPAIVDRISLKRTLSSASSTSASSGTSSTRLAFTAQVSASSSFRVPALLRRATTNSTLISGSSASSSAAPSTGLGSAGGFGEEAKIKKGAGKKSGVSRLAREPEQRVKMQESERRREERKAKGAEKRVGMVGGLLAKGSFA